MNVYLSIVAGALKLVNAIASALQQHHDELNGRRAQVLEEQDATIEQAQRAVDARNDPANLKLVHDSSSRD